MDLSEKILQLRKKNSWSQEELAEKVNVSRQAVSRWEGGTALPDAVNILQLSRLFGVTADYLLNDTFESDEDLPKVRAVRTDSLRLIMIILVTLSVMNVILQFMASIVLQSTFFTVLSFIPFAALIGGFEFACQKCAGEKSDAAIGIRRKFYLISAWLGLYFPIRLVISSLAKYYPRPYTPVALEGVVLLIYLTAAILITLGIKRNRTKNK